MITPFKIYKTLFTITAWAAITYTIFHLHDLYQYKRRWSQESIEFNTSMLRQMRLEDVYLVSFDDDNYIFTRDDQRAYFMVTFKDGKTKAFAYSRND